MICSKSNVSLVRRKRVLMSEDLRTDHVKLESSSILTKNFLPGHWGGLGPLGPLVYASVSVIPAEALSDVRIHRSASTDLRMSQKADYVVWFWSFSLAYRSYGSTSKPTIPRAFLSQSVQITYSVPWYVKTRSI